MIIYKKTLKQCFCFQLFFWAKVLQVTDTEYMTCVYDNATRDDDDVECDNHDDADDLGILGNVGNVGICCQ